ncbi:DUF937 domain-containing protein [Oryzicola mucosus]|uniref:DUF937 domain-containing protein n=1 Tax=Oryzicola mucosus TaxID=2767425 RepID=A0A8J6PGS4_9HYPH|nr:DUF937 domain-containing protein [Oryzicola mucosus]MBD0413076.1 DUF937 domain-containing protein [Oryzicola mucosus]
MLPLYDMLANAQNGNGMEALARQFNLSQQQTQAAVEALLPAFSQGLKRNATDPYGVSSFMNALATGQHAQYFEDVSRAYSPQGVNEGNGILGHLFGSKDLSRAIAGQAAQATGIGQTILQQMLPVIASMIMGGMFKQSTNQLQPDSGMANNPFGQIFEQMMRQGGIGGAQPQQRQAPQTASPFDNPFGKVLQDMFGGGQQQQRTPEPASSPYGDNPFGKIFEDMMGGGQRRSAPEPEPAPQPKANPSGRAKNPYDDLFGQMFDTGSKQRDEYQKGVESIFDQFLKGMDRNR